MVLFSIKTEVTHNRLHKVSCKGDVTDGIPDKSQKLDNHKDYAHDGLEGSRFNNLGLVVLKGETNSTHQSNKKSQCQRNKEYNSSNKSVWINHLLELAHWTN